MRKEMLLVCSIMIWMNRYKSHVGSIANYSGACFSSESNRMDLELTPNNLPLNYLVVDSTLSCAF